MINIIQLSIRSNLDAVSLFCGKERAVDLAFSIPIFTYGHELSVVTERMSSHIQVAEMTSLKGVWSQPLRLEEELRHTGCYTLGTSY